jgi:hypothetical protein
MVVRPSNRDLEIFMDDPNLPHVTPKHNPRLQEAVPRAHTAIQPAHSSAARRKAALVDTGLYALHRGHRQMVDAITGVIRERGWCHD